MNIITIKNVRAYLDENGTAQINLEDAARGLGFTTRVGGKEYVRWETVAGYLVDIGFLQEVAKDCGRTIQEQLPEFIPENIFYRLAMKAKNETAEKFQAIVADEILPSIRKHGAYITPAMLENMIASPEFGIKLLSALKDEKEKVRQLSAKVEEDHPKVLFADSVSAASNSILIGELAKLIKQNGRDIGQNRLFEWMRQNGFLISRKGTDFNMPTQRSMEMKLFTIKETTINKPDGSIHISKTVKVTGKGQIYFINIFCGKKAG